MISLQFLWMPKLSSLLRADGTQSQIEDPIVIHELVIRSLIYTRCFQRLKQLLLGMWVYDTASTLFFGIFYRIRINWGQSRFGHFMCTISAGLEAVDICDWPSYDLSDASFTSWWQELWLLWAHFVHTREALLLGRQIAHFFNWRWRNELDLRGRTFTIWVQSFDVFLWQIGKIHIWGKMWSRRHLVT